MDVSVYHNKFKATTIDFSQHTDLYQKNKAKRNTVVRKSKSIKSSKSNKGKINSYSKLQDSTSLLKVYKQS